MPATRLFLVDDHAILRESLQLLIGSQPDFEVVGCAAGFADAFRGIQELQPDVVCVDLSMPGESGLRLIQQVAPRVAYTRWLVLTMHDDPSYLRAALTAGCNGYVLKSSRPAVLLAAIRAVARGELVIDEAVCEHLRRGRPASAELSHREREVLGMLAQGLSHRQIAERLFLSAKTIETYRTRLGKKLGLCDRADLVRYAVEFGLFE